MSSFWEDREEEYYRKREAGYIDDPNQIAWRSLAYGLGLVLFFFVFCPMNEKRLNKEAEQYIRPCRHSFYKYPMYGVIKEKEIDTKLRISRLHIQSLESNSIERIECRCEEVYKLDEAVEIGDTIIKSADTLWVKILNYPKYRELNYNKIYKEK